MIFVRHITRCVLCDGIRRPKGKGARIECTACGITEYVGDAKRETVHRETHTPGPPGRPPMKIMWAAFKKNAMQNATLKNLPAFTNQQAYLAMCGLSTSGKSAGVLPAPQPVKDALPFIVPPRQSGKSLTTLSVSVFQQMMNDPEIQKIPT